MTTTMDYAEALAKLYRETASKPDALENAAMRVIAQVQSDTKADARRAALEERDALRVLDEVNNKSWDDEREHLIAQGNRALEAARRLRRFMDAYFTDNNITDEAGDVLGETAWIEGGR